MQKLFLLLGRILLSMIFFSSAIGKLLSWGSTKDYMMTSLSQWMQATAMTSPVLHQTVMALYPHAGVILIIALLLEGIGGILVLLGFRVYLGTIMLIFFIVPVTLVCHPFWLMAGAEKTVQLSLFMKNLSILGGLLILAATTKSGELK